MKKFFLFRKEELNASSVTASDSGQGISVLALPTDSLAFVSAGVGFVVLSFNGATMYEESNLTDGESLEKTTVKVPCEVGSEVSLIESILGFISREGGRSLMRFDAVESESTFSPVSFDSKIESKLHINPVKRVTGLSSTQTFIGSTGTVGADATSTVIADIDFGIAANLPTIDYNHEDLESKSVGAEINSWANSGTGGNTYNIGTNVGNPTVGAAKTGFFSTRNASFDGNDYFIIPTFTVSGEYTLYISYLQTLNESHVIYGDGDGECFGFTVGPTVYDADGLLSKHRPSSVGKFVVRHADRTGEPASSETIGTENGTVSYKYPNYDTGESHKVITFVIRRDDVGNMYMYNHNGDLVSFIAARTADTLFYEGVRYTDATAGRTDGPLKIERLANSGDYVGTNFAFYGAIARFGVIERDIGSAACSKLATDLFNFYKN
jgi:hypothetical protein